MRRRNEADPSAPAPNRRRRVLMIAYYFPPLGGGGVQRTLKHVKYLPDHGFDPVVVTVRAIRQPLRDPSLASEVPAQAIVIRAPELPLYLVKWGLQGALRRVRLPTGPARVVGWPDELVGWAPGAVWCALKAVRRYRPDVIYSTSSPVSAHAVALVVSRLTGLPWVADFRDAWTLNPQGARRYAGLSARLERRIVRAARGLVVVDESVELVGAPAEDPRRVVISNGVDPEDFPTLPDVVAGPRMRLAYIGMLYGARDAAPVFAALRNLVACGALDPEKVELRIVGDVSVGAAIDLAGIQLIRTGQVDHRLSLAEIAAADVLLLYQPPGQRGSSGKIYEYLATGRPVLCVAPTDGVAARLVAELGVGVCAAPDDQAAIEQAVEGLYQDWLAGRLKTNPWAREEALRRFSRRELARQLAEVLVDACRLP